MEVRDRTCSTKLSDFIEPIWSDNYCAIAVNSSNEYVPYLSVYLLSVKMHAAADHKYDVIILENSITENNKRILKEMFETTPNFSLRFYNPSKLFNFDELTVMHPYLCKESYFRLASPMLFKHYKRLIFTDVDLIFNEDPFELYNFEMDNYCLLSAIEPVWSNWINNNKVQSDINIVEYSKNTLELDNLHYYFNTGVMLLDINRLNNINASELMLEKLSSGKKYLYQDQCIINEVLKEKIGILPFAWNKEVINHDILNDVEENIKQYCNIDRQNVLHWIGSQKPWANFQRQYSEKWWQIAKLSPFYEIILEKKFCTNLIEETNKLKKTQRQIINKVNDFIHLIKYEENLKKYRKYHILCNFTFGKTKERYRYKKKIYKKYLDRAEKLLGEING